MILFIITQGNARYLCWANDREEAKRQAREHWLYDDPDRYIVTPLTNPGDRVHVGLTLNV